MAKMVEGIAEGQKRAAQALEQMVIEASSGGGAVRAKATGSGRLLDVEIAPEAVDPEDIEMLQDLIVTAVREVLRQANEAAKEKRMEALGPWAGLLGDMGPGLL